MSDTASNEQKPAQENGANILIVDDMEMNRDLLRDVVSIMGHNSHLAENGVKALELMLDEPPDLVLLDILMPVMDGYEVLRRMKEDSRFQHIPVIMITALDNIDSAVKCLEKGADDYIVKPFSHALLTARIRGSLHKKRLEDQNRELLNEVMAQQKVLNHELKLAEKVQMAMLPLKEHNKRYPGCSIETFYRAASSIGGDFYHFTEYGDRKIAFFIADVSGHGPAAALIVAALKTTLDNESLDRPSPARLMERLNRKLIPIIPEGRFATAFFCVADFGKKNLTYTCAGHPPSFLFGPKRDETTYLGARGPWIGMFDDEEYREDTVTFGHGDKLLLYTDGLFETEGRDGEPYGLDRLKKIIDDSHSSSCKKIIDLLVYEADNFWDGESERDDIALVAIELSGFDE